MLFKLLPGYDTIWTWPYSAAATRVSAVTKLLGQFDVQLDRSFAVYLPNSSSACCYRHTAWQEFGRVLTRQLLGLLSPNCSASLMYTLAEFGHVLTWWLFCLLSQNHVQLDRSLAVYLPDSSCVCCHWTAQPVWHTTLQESVLTRRLFCTELLRHFDIQLGMSLAMFLHGSSCAYCYRTALPVWHTT